MVAAVVTRPQGGGGDMLSSALTSNTTVSWPQSDADVDIIVFSVFVIVRVRKLD